MAPSFSRPLLVRVGLAAAGAWLTGYGVWRLAGVSSPWFLVAALLLPLLPVLVAWRYARAHETRLLHDVASPLRRRFEGQRRTFSELDRRDLVSWIARMLESGLADLDRAEARRAIEWRTLLAVLETASDGVSIASEEGEVRYLSPRARRFWRAPGLSENQVLRTEVLFRNREEVFDSWRQAVETGELLQVEHTADEGRDSLLVIHAPLHFPSSPSEWLTMQRDISEVARIRVIRRDFIGNLSHEIRNALAKIRANAEIATLADTAEDRARYMQRLLSTVQEMNQLQMGLMDLFSIETGLAPIRPVPTRLSEFLPAVFESLQAEALAHDLHFQLGVIPDLTLSLDAPKITRVITNLVQNAIRHTPPGGRIVLEATVGPLPADDPGFSEGLPLHLNTEERQLQLSGEPVAVFHVRDTGPGIPTPLIPRVFERLHQLDDGRNDMGTGLGLSLARHTLRAHGGLIWGQNNQPGPGITFSFGLPLPLPPEPQAVSNARPGTASPTAADAVDS